MPVLEDRIKRAGQLSRTRMGNQVAFYLPGMFRLNGHTGKYPALSITGNACALECDHCKTKILTPMVQTPNPEDLLKKCIELDKKGNLGVLISGGCREDGSLNWPPFLQAISQIKAQTRLYVSIHSGLVDEKTAMDLKQAGVDQALLDIIGDDETFQKVYHVPFGVDRMERAMAALAKAGIPMVPHIVCGIDYGRITGEHRAVEMISRFKIAQLVVVSLMRLSGTPMANVSPPSAEQVADVIAAARLAMPDTVISLGCARQRGSSRMEILALDAGVNRMALPSEEAIAHAGHLGLDIRFQPTCCSVSTDFSTDSWHD